MGLRRTRVGVMLKLVGILAVATLLPGCPSTPNGGGGGPGDRGLRGTITEIRRGPQQDLVAVVWPGPKPMRGRVCFAPSRMPIQPTDSEIDTGQSTAPDGLCAWAPEMPGAMHGRYEAGDPNNCPSPQPCQ